ncbi:MAG: hypothetical protein JSR61_22220 [Proteobacteria bacterium]|nr:hypothetical protein [Pseudomonadota bacterium]
MPDQTVTPQDAQTLRYAAEEFAKIAVANAIWLTGELLAQRDAKRAHFVPDEIYIWQVRRLEESLALLDRLPEAQRHRVFICAFRFRPYYGENIFEQLLTKHTDMLDEVFRNEWHRRMRRHRGLTTVANQLLPKPRASR